MVRFAEIDTDFRGAWKFVCCKNIVERVVYAPTLGVVLIVTMSIISFVLCLAFLLAVIATYRDINQKIIHIQEDLPFSCQTSP